MAKVATSVWLGLLLFVAFCVNAVLELVGPQRVGLTDARNRWGGSSGTVAGGSVCTKAFNCTTAGISFCISRSCRSCPKTPKNALGKGNLKLSPVPKNCATGTSQGACTGAVVCGCTITPAKAVKCGTLTWLTKVGTHG